LGNLSELLVLEESLLYANFSFIRMIIHEAILVCYRAPLTETFAFPDFLFPPGAILVQLPWKQWTILTL
jgi:hypothetical protein